MAEYELTRKTIEDLVNIWNFTFDQGLENPADKNDTFLLATCQDNADNPDLGKSHPGVLTDLKERKSNPSHD